MNFSYIFLLVVSVLGVYIKGQVQVDPLKDLALDYSTKIELDNKQQYLTENGEFKFNNIEKGVYVLQVLSTEYIFPRITVVVNDDGISAFESPLGSSLDQLGNPISYPLELQARAVLDYSTVFQS
jgi:hypothetical protein